MICPLCEKELQWYRISFSAKFQICSNLSCEYPFNLTETEVRCRLLTLSNDNCNNIETANLLDAGFGNSSEDLAQEDPLLTLLNDESNYIETPNLLDSSIGESSEDLAQEDPLGLNAYLDAEDSDEDKTEEPEETKINKLLQQSSTLVAMLNQRQNKKLTKQNITDAKYLRQLVNLHPSRKSKHSLLSQQEFRIMKDSEQKIKMTEAIQVNIQLPKDAHSLIKVDIIKP